MTLNTWMAALALLTLPVTAWAHAFSVVLIVPAGEPQIAQDMERAFLLAADERDQHPDNHADGHLGGLDVYLVVMENADAEAIATAAPEIVIDALASPGAAHQGEERLWISGGDLERLDRERMLGSADPDLPAFSGRFESATGRIPSPQAEAAYLAARLIDLIVRPLDDASDPLALRRAIDRLR